jgi:hypothetical protein
MFLSENLTKLMSENQIQLDELSRKTGVPKEVILSFLNSQEIETFLYLKKLSEFFNISAEDLCFSHGLKEVKFLGELGSIEFFIKIKK